MAAHIDAISTDYGQSGHCPSVMSSFLDGKSQQMDLHAQSLQLEQDSPEHCQMNEQSSTHNGLAVGKKHPRPTTNQLFPQKLYQMLDAEENAGQEDIISYTQSGQSFRVHNPETFASEVIPHYFGHNHYPTFQHKLRMHGFERLQHGMEAGAYMLPFF